MSKNAPQNAASGFSGVGAVALPDVGRKAAGRFQRGAGVGVTQTMESRANA